MIYSSTFLIETLTDQTSFGAGQPWIWREHEELSRHLHKLFILITIFYSNMGPNICDPDSATLQCFFDSAPKSFVVEVFEPCSQNLAFILTVFQS